MTRTIASQTREPDPRADPSMSTLRRYLVLVTRNRSPTTTPAATTLLSSMLLSTISSNTAEK